VVVATREVDLELLEQGRVELGISGCHLLGSDREVVTEVGDESVRDLLRSDCVLFAVEVIGANREAERAARQSQQIGVRETTWPKASFEVSVVVSCGATKLRTVGCCARRRYRDWSCCRVPPAGWTHLHSLCR